MRRMHRADWACSVNNGQYVRKIHVIEQGSKPLVTLCQRRLGSRRWLVETGKPDEATCTWCRKQVQRRNLLLRKSG
jgi:hypothetical protein